MATIYVTMKDSPATVEKKIISSIQARLNAIFHAAAPAIRGEIQALCDHMIEGTPEYQSLIRGELLAELGLPDPERRVRAVVEAVKNGVDVTTVPLQTRGKNLVGGINIKLLRGDYEDILNITEASYYSNKFEIPWLNWLIMQGDQIIVMSHEINYDLSPSQRIRSRSGMALMRPGSGWRVPPWASGTPDDNFLTRAFDVVQIDRRVGDIVAQQIARRL